MILNVASIGTASSAPATPHIRYQKTRAMITATGLSVSRRASSVDVTTSPSTTWMPKYKGSDKSGERRPQRNRLLARLLFDLWFLGINRRLRRWRRHSEI